MAKTQQIPKQLRITFTEQVDRVLLNPEEPDYHNYKWEEIIGTRLGFANVYDPHTKAYDKRRQTQDQWAYGNSTPKIVDGLVYRVGNHWVENPENPKGRKIIAHMNEPYRDYLQPIIIDNEPLEGFRIVKTVSRYTTSNKWWRIRDPRDFELEISSANLEELILGGSIDKGLIPGKCIWAGPKTLVRV